MKSAAALAAALALTCACSKPPSEPRLTWFNGEHAVSIRYPSNWTTEQDERDGVWYRYFQAPPSGAARAGPLTATLFVSPLSTSLDEYAQSYVAGKTVTHSAPDARTAAHGQSWSFDGPDGQRHFLLLLFEDTPAGGPSGPPAAAPRVYGFHAQGATADFEQQRPLIEAMAASLTLEHPRHYRELGDESFHWSLRVPASWPETRHFSGSGNMLMQFTSPALAADRNGRTVHASLTVSVEELPAGGDLDSFYKTARERLGDAHKVVTHARWGRGYADSLRLETSVSASRQRRYYAASERYGYTLSFEARDDAFFRVARWCDLIAGTLQVDGTPAGPGPEEPTPAPGSRP